MSRILGIDYGDRRIGLALSDPLQIIAKPLTVIDRKYILDYFSAIEKIVIDMKIISIVVGIPMNMKGEKSIQTNKTIKFIKLLEANLNIPIIGIDERLSSLTAEKYLSQQFIKPSQNKELIDETAAAIILQEYLDSSKQ